MFALLLACSSPTVTVSTSTTQDLPMLSGVQGFAGGKLQKALDSCYAEALAEDPELSGTVTAEVSGSHGILKVETTGAAGALEACVREPLEDSRNQRALGDGDNTAGTSFKVVFSP